VTRRWSSFLELVHDRATSSPERRAFTFLIDGGRGELHVSFAELDLAARRIGAGMRAHGLESGDRVLLIAAPGLAFIRGLIGCWYAGAIAVPCYPPEAQAGSARARLRSVADSCGATLTLTDAAVAQAIRNAPPERALPLPPLLEIDHLAAGSSGALDVGPVARQTPAVLQYTSGSTGEPKGVVLTHGALLHNSGLIARAFQLTPESVSMIWLPPYHDMGLIGGILQSLYTGYYTVLMSPLAFVLRPLRWLSAISRYRATVSGGPNFAYDLCSQKIDDDAVAQLDLRSWRVAFNGAEAVRSDTLERFARKFARAGFRREAFYPCYGLAEATLIVTGGDVDQPAVVRAFDREALERGRAVAVAEGAERSVPLVSSGRPLGDQDVRVVQPDGARDCADHEIGEIWVRGDSVAPGYWERPEQTAESFGAAYGDQTGFLRTGDLGFFQDGELFIAGRRKELLIVRGRKYHPADIERTAQDADPSLRGLPGAAFAVDERGAVGADGPAAGAGRSAVTIDVVDGARVVLVQGTGRSPQDPAGLAARIRQQVGRDHGIELAEIVLVPSSAIPRTTSGKIQRGRCRELHLRGELVPLFTSAIEIDAVDDTGQDAGGASVTAGAGAGPTAVTSAVLAALGRALSIAPDHIDRTRSLPELGLTSLAAVQLQNRLESIGVPVSAADLLHGDTPVDQILADAVDRAARGAGPIAPPAAPREPRSATSGAPSDGQRGLHFAQQLAPHSAAWIIASGLTLRGPLQIPRLERALALIVERHASLRARFVTDSGELRVHVDDAPGRLDFAVCAASGVPDDALAALLAREASRPFALHADPPLRARLFARSSDDHVLLIVVHHLVADLWSLAVLFRDLSRAYGAGELAVSPDVPSYQDHVAWQASLIASEQGEALLERWQRRLAGPLPQLDLPADHPRPAFPSHRGGSVRIEAGAALLDRARALARASHTTLYTVLAAAYVALLHRHTGQRDILVGTPTAGRARAEWEEVVGYFVNPVVLRAQLPTGMSFRALVHQLRGVVSQSVALQHYPFARLCERLELPVDPGRSPLFQAMFVLQEVPPGLALPAALAIGGGSERVALGDLEATPFPVPQDTAQLDLSLTLALSGSGIHGQLQYSADLFDHATAERMARHFGQLLRDAVDAPDRRISELAMLADGERQQLRVDFNRTDMRWTGAPRLLHQLFEAQVTRTPGALALRFEGEELGYDELNRRANRLARELRGHGIGPDDPVGVFMDRSIAMVVALLATLKAGGAYVPLDPALPPLRIASLVEQARCKAILVDAGAAALDPSLAPGSVVIDAGQRLAGRDDGNLDLSQPARSLAYVIFTSGSTGAPKGVMIPHEGIVNRLLWMQDHYRLTSGDRILQKTPFTFDVSVWELFWPLVAGAALVVARPGGHRDPAYLAHIIERERVSVAHFVPSMLRVFLTDRAGAELALASLRLVICSGEVLPVDLVTELFRQLPGVSLENLYGPTEASVDVTAWSYTAPSLHARVPIGRPIANTQIYVVDSDLALVPIGVPGELVISGIGVGRGYAGRPDLTAEWFVPDPLSAEPGRRLYRTGDVARVRPDGAIDFLGRRDHQVKVRGFRIEPAEIERALMQHGAVGNALVVATPARSGTILVAYLEGSGGERQSQELLRFVRQRLPDYMVPQRLVWLPSFPLTESGKVDRRALPAAAESGPEPAQDRAPRTPLQEVLADIVSDVLGVRIGLGTSWFDAGGHSLQLIQIVARIRRHLGVELPVRLLFESPTVEGLAAAVAAATPGARPAPPLSLAAPDPISIPSRAQERLWFVQTLDPASPAYNMPQALRVTGALDPEVLERCFQAVLDRHSALRTSFHEQAGVPIARVHPHVAARFRRVDLSLAPREHRDAQARALFEEDCETPFDLSAAPLMRVTLVQIDTDEHVLLVNVHHIVFDGWSHVLLVEDFARVYAALARGQAPPPHDAPIHYASFARWQRGASTDAAMAERLAVWRRRLDGAIPQLLPDGRPRPSRVEAGRAASHETTLSAELTGALRGLARRQAATLFMELVASMAILLHRYLGDDRLLIGTSIAGRTHAELERVIGFFVNTLVLSVDVSGEPSFTELLARVRDMTLRAYDDQDLPYDLAISELRGSRLPASHPVVQVLLSYQTLPAADLALEGLEIRTTDLGRPRFVKFDLNINVTDTESGLALAVEYNKAIFSEEWIRTFMDQWRSLLGQAALDPTSSITHYSLDGGLAASASEQVG
jgi:amino acid adenylation domain-containing protein